MDIIDLDRALIDGRCINLYNLRPKTKAVQVFSFLEPLHLDIERVEVFGGALGRLEGFVVFYRRQDARSAIKSLSGTKDINLASTSPESRYSYSDVWTKAESMEESAVTLASDVKGTLPMQETYHRAFLSPLPRMEDRELLEGMVRDVFHGFKIERIIILLSLGKDKKATKSCFCLVDFATAEKARQAIKMANGTSASWGVLRVKKADGWAATYLQERSGKAEGEKKDVREESSKGQV